MRISMVGLGQMGKPIAYNLAKKYPELLVSDLSESVLGEFSSKGIRTSRENREIADCDVLLLCLPNENVVKATLFGENGLMPFLKSGVIVADLSTIDYHSVGEIAEKLEEKEILFMDAPISGMQKKAEDGTLTVMCGGVESLFACLHPIFESIGTNILLMGPLGSGQLTKALNNTLFDINAAAVAEIFPLGIKLGLDTEKFMEVINNSSGKSFASEFFLPRILKRNFSEGYPMDHAYKDLVSSGELSIRMKAPLPVTHAATTTYQMALSEGLGGLDKGAMIQVFERLLKITCEMK